MELWYYTSEGKQMDPVTIRELGRLAQDGALKPTDMVWKEGMARWMRASSVKELFPDPSGAVDQYFSTAPKELNAPKAVPIIAPSALSIAGGGEDGNSGAVTAKKTAPQPETDDARSRRRRPEEEDGFPARRRPNGGASNLGIILALLFGGGILLVAILVGAVILIVVKPKPLAPINPDNLVKGEVKYNLALAPNTSNNRNISFKKGIEYELIVKTQPKGQHVDVDIHIYDSNNIERIKEDKEDSDCYQRWIPDTDGEYRVEVKNLDQRGIAVPVTCNVIIREFKEQPIVNPKELPKDPPLPPDVKTGKDNVEVPLLAPGKEHVFKLRVKADYKARVRVQTFDVKKGSGADLNLYILKEVGDEQMFADTSPKAGAEVNFTVPTTQIVRVRVHNASATSANTATVYFDVAPEKGKQ